mgnify:CR=1 FL=1
MEQSMQNKGVDISIIIPIFNQEEHIEECVNLILEEVSGVVSAEILLINDGSEDNSVAICAKMAVQNPEVKCFHQENLGVSAARNYGIRNAKGKYIFYLDADDRFTKGTIIKLKKFFDSVQEEVDLVTYRIDTIFEGRVLAPHFRYQYLKESGVYDLREYPYIGQTTMNIVVKNKFEHNVLFDEKQTFSEDQKYCCEVLKDKLKMGFCAEGTYIYYRSNNSSSGKLSGACYIFEQCTHFFEELFYWYEKEEEIPAAFQGLFVNDFFWKLCSNILFPYHYNEAEYENALQRLKMLLSRCSNEIILNHPKIDFFEKYYMLCLKNKKELQYKIEDSGFGLWNKKICTIYEKSVEIVMTKCQIRKNKVVIHGFLKTVFFQFYEEMPLLCAVENEGELTKKLTLRPSAHNYYLSHEGTQNFWAFTYECDANKVSKVSFEMGLNGKWFPVHYYFMPCVPFSHARKRYTYVNNGVKLSIDKKNDIYISRWKETKRKIIWLYYDCTGVAFDNGMMQFLHDYGKKDGIVRYYVVSDERQRQYLPNRNCAIQWGGIKHKQLFLKCQKIITAFIEEENIIPFPRERYDTYAGEFHFEIVYLQHGVLHIEMPWKYTPERILADRVVVSTKQEAELFCSNGFSDKDLLKCRMPRFEQRRELQTESKKILFAPSWRSYLVGGYVNRQWVKLEEKFRASAYYKNIQVFLESKKLEQLLQKYDYTLEVKLHPIFYMYKEYFVFQSSRIRMIEKTEVAENYGICITDISSFAYDYIFQEIPVFWFLPDVVEFKSGMNGYRNMGEKEYWDKVAVSAEELLEQLLLYIKEGIYEGILTEFYENDSPMEEIYQKEIRR